MKLIMIVGLMCGAVYPAAGQVLPTGFDAERLLRQNLKLKRTEILTTAMHLTEAESRKFWPLQREYENEVARLNDRAFDLLRRYMTSHDKMADSDAAGATREGLRLDKQRIALREKYFLKISKVLSRKVASRFIQVDSLLHSIASVQIAGGVPLVE